jgi:hypothetical protein
MPIVFNVIFSFLLSFGFYFIGEKFVKIFKIRNLITYISNPIYQYPILGVSVFLFLAYPLFFFQIFNKHLITLISIIFVLLGVLQIGLKFDKILLLLKKRGWATYEINKGNWEINKLLVLILLILYFIVSISPITSADSVAYHLSVSKFILNNGIFPTALYDFENSLASNQEFLNAFALSIKAYQFTSFINYLGLISIISIIFNFCKKFRLASNLTFFIILLIVSVPTLIFLLSSSKHQFFSVSLIFISFAFLYIFKQIKNSKEATKVFFLINILLLTAICSKISFAFSFFLINIFLLFSKKKYFFKFILVLLLLSMFELLPISVWKSIIYNYDFYHFLYNPLPINFPGYDNFYIFLKNYLSDKFPLSLIFSWNPREFTNALGFGCFVLLFLINNLSKRIYSYVFLIITFLIIYLFFGLKSPRFYLEIYLFSIFIFFLIIPSLQHDRLFIYFKYLIYFQSFLVIIALTYFTFLIFPGNFSKRLHDKVLNNNADGYSLYSWVNTIILDNSSIIVDHRSTFFLNTINYIYPSVLTYLDLNDTNSINFYLEKIKEKNPKFIIIHDQKQKYNYMNYDFKDCINGLYIYKNKVGFNANRNPFNNAQKEYYNAYIYNFDSKKLPGCVKVILTK